jgi:TRAP-type mannitol/chloroaromatic compound transport system permease small subunit
MKQLPKLVLVIDRLNRAIGVLCRWLVLLMLALGGWNVIGRYLGLLVGRNLSSNSLIEGQWYLFALIFLLGAGYTLQRNGHVRVDVLRTRWPPRRQARMEVIGTLLFLLPFCLVMVLTSLDTVAESWRIAEGSPDPAGLPRFPIKTIIPLGFLLLMAQGISEAIKNWPLAFPPGRHNPRQPEERG